MGSWKAGGNSTSPPEITTSESSGSTRNRAGESILGPARRATCTRVNSKRASATAEAPSGGPTAAGTKASSERESKAAGAYSTAREDTASTRATGITACSTARERSTSKWRAVCGHLQGGQVPWLGGVL